MTLHVTPAVRLKFERAADQVHLDLGVWGRQKLAMVADFQLAGIPIEVAFKAAMDELAKSNPAAYQVTLTALGKTNGPQKKAP